MGTDGQSADLLGAALEYLAAGLHPLPAHSVRNGHCTCAKGKACGSAGKHPRVSWKEHQRTAPTEALIRQWWRRWPDANVGTATGPDAGVLVIEVDPLGTNRDESNPWRPGDGKSVVARSGGGGLHFFYRYPPGHDIRNSAGAIADGVDVRAAGGFDVLPPSLHRSGNRYEWLRPPNGQLPDVPAHLLGQLISTNGRQRAEPTECAEPADLPDLERRAVAYLAAMPPAISGSGGHNATYAAAVALVRGFRLPPERALALLTSEFNPRCEPPWSEKELGHKVDDAARKPHAKPAGWLAEARSPRYSPTDFDQSQRSAATPVGEPTRLTEFPLTDSGLVEIMAHLRGGEFLFDHGTRHWLQWAGHWWTQDRDGAVHRAVLECVRELQSAIVFEVDDPDKKRARQTKAIGYENRTRLEAVVACARNIEPFTTTGDDLDANPVLLGVGNGVVDLRSGQVGDGKPADRITMHTEIPFDPEAKCPRFIQFLDEVFQSREDLINWLWRAIGYSLTGEVVERLLFLLYGRGQNGKSVLLSILRHVAGNYAANMTFQALELGSKASIANDIADLRSKRLVTASETNEAMRLNVARLKALAGGSDAITGRRLYENNVTFDPQCKLWLAVNDKPTVRDDSDAFWDRLRLIPFERRFEGEEKDIRLVEKLQAEAPGILAWTVRGAAEYYRRGLHDTPACVTAAVADYRTDSDPLAGFLDDTCVLKNDAEVGAADFHREYQRWAERNGLRDREILGRTAFGRIAGKRFEKTRTNAGAVYRGVGVLCQWDADDPDSDE